MFLSTYEKQLDGKRRLLIPNDFRTAENGDEALRRLAEDSARGTQRAIDQIRDIVKTARSLQTYDQTGQRRNSPTNAVLPQRF